jgi:hypothetical protein
MNTNKIKFNKYNVTNGKIKARVRYILDNRCDKKKCVTIYAKDYNNDLGKIFDFKNGYKNNSDVQIDYFETGMINFFEDSPFYLEARKRAEMNQNKG